MANEIDKNSTATRNLLNPKGKNKHVYSLISLLVVVVLTLVFYLVPDYFFLEKTTADMVFQILRFYKFDVTFDGLYTESLPGEEGSFINSLMAFITGLDTHGAQSPVIKDLSVGKRFAVVRACTGMQAGALLIALIVVTPADNWSKIKATSFSVIALIIANFLRIALIIGMTVFLMEGYGVDYERAWFWSHDVLGKPIGFFGTIVFAFIIEGQGVPILNTVSLWIDSLLDMVDSISKKSRPYWKKAKPGFWSVIDGTLLEYVFYLYVIPVFIIILIFNTIKNFFIYIKNGVRKKKTTD